MNFFFWQNIISPHQASFLRALADQGHEVCVVSEDTMTADRVALGWKVPDLGGARIVVKPSPVEIRQLVTESSNDSIHVMAGARWTPLGNLAEQLCRKLGRRIGIMTESPDPRGLLGCARRGKYTWERIQKGSCFQFILAMGEMGARWFCHCGYPESKVFPFVYITEAVIAPSPVCVDETVKSAFFGQFIPRKGLDILINAFARVENKNSILQLIGEGPEKENLTKLAENLGVGSRVMFLPKRDAVGVQSAMEKADITLLPSRHDGWGAVVNESLSVGTPVICSSACGAAELIREPWLGSVFRSGNIPELAKALEYWVGLGPRKQVERDRIRNWSQSIQGQSVANYFISIMDHLYSGAKRPEAPWRIPATDRQA